MYWKDIIIADWIINGSSRGGNEGCGCGCGCFFVMIIGSIILSVIFDPDDFLPLIIMIGLAVGLIVLLYKLIKKLIAGPLYKRQIKRNIKRELKEQYRLYKKWYKKGRLTPFETQRLQHLNKWRGTEEVSIRLKALEEKEKQKAAKKEHKDIYY